ncbi:MAG TPA: hypothetical protein PKU94_06190 [Candidatus Hydrothermia bacterium]|nr:hypothetical protein [Candidatus Hydrothermia bacterium]
MDDEYKRCCHCKRLLPLSAFTKNRLMADGHSVACRECTAKYSRRYRERKRSGLGDQAFKDYIWSLKVKRECREAGVPVNGMDVDKVNRTRIKLADYIVGSSLGVGGYVDIMKKYGLTFEEFKAIREKVRAGEFRVYPSDSPHYGFY